MFPWADPEGEDKPAFNVGPSFKWRYGVRWWADNGPFLVLFGSPLPSSKKKKKKKNVVRVGPPLNKLSRSAHGGGSFEYQHTALVEKFENLILVAHSYL